MFGEEFQTFRFLLSVIAPYTEGSVWSGLRHDRLNRYFSEMEF